MRVTQALVAKVWHYRDDCDANMPCLSAQVGPNRKTHTDTHPQHATAFSAQTPHLCPKLAAPKERSISRTIDKGTGHCESSPHDRCDTSESTEIPIKTCAQLRAATVAFHPSAKGTQKLESSDSVNAVLPATPLRAERLPGKNRCDRIVKHTKTLLPLQQRRVQ
jgi:hypothetical protein